MDAKPRQAVAYVRGPRSRLDWQRSAITSWARVEDFEVVAWFTDRELDVEPELRPGFMAAREAARGVGTLVVASMDRLSTGHIDRAKALLAKACVTVESAVLGKRAAPPMAVAEAAGDAGS